MKTRKMNGAQRHGKDLRSPMEARNSHSLSNIAPQKQEILTKPRKKKKTELWMSVLQKPESNERYKTK